MSALSHKPNKASPDFPLGHFQGPCYHESVRIHRHKPVRELSNMSKPRPLTDYAHGHLASACPLIRGSACLRVFCGNGQLLSRLFQGMGGNSGIVALAANQAGKLM
ncbi:hypothetical protein TrVFT333_006828 [Trichoderma virens FT-333]|nr:hypothetical protein TrVFT333_006828 [Trichoderma virens FT-333]